MSGIHELGRFSQSASQVPYRMKDRHVELYCVHVLWTFTLSLKIRIDAKSRFFLS